MSNEVEARLAALESDRERVAALEQVVAEQRDLLLKVIQSPSMKMLSLAVDGAPLSRINWVPVEKARPADNKVHPADQAIKDGTKLQALAAQDLGVRK